MWERAIYATPRSLSAGSTLVASPLIMEMARIQGGVICSRRHSRSGSVISSLTTELRDLRHPVQILRAFQAAMRIPILVVTLPTSLLRMTIVTEQTQYKFARAYGL